MLSLLRCGAIFGFFDASTCSTFWGLDKIDTDAAITTMQAMNTTVCNAGFVLAFSDASVVLLSALCWRMADATDELRFFSMVGLFGGVGGLALKMVINVQMNQALAVI